MKDRKLDKITTIQLTESFKLWLSAQGVKGDTYQDILLKVIQDLPPEKLVKYILQGGFNYEETSRILGIQIDENLKPKLKTIK